MLPILICAAGWIAAGLILWRARVVVRRLRAGHASYRQAVHLSEVDLAAARNALRVESTVITDYRTRLAEILSTYDRYSVAEVTDRPMGRLISMTGDSFTHAAHIIRVQRERIAYLESHQASDDTIVIGAKPVLPDGESTS